MCEKNISESKDSFGVPCPTKAPRNFRGSFRHFMWEEAYKEFKREYARTTNPPMEPLQTEYQQKFYREVPPEDAARKLALAHRYPLYGTTPITTYNKTGDAAQSFRRKYSITRPVDMQTEQFG